MMSVMTGMPLPAAFLNGLREALERLSDGPLAPALDLYSTHETIVAKVALPGVKPENVDVTVGEGLVTISGLVQEDKGTSESGYGHKELSHGSFSRSFWLPTAVEAEAATAFLKDGLLTLTLPKTKEVKQQRIKVDVRRTPFQLAAQPKS
jgi:HSP20 family protein